MNTNLAKNSEGYSDPTAYFGTRKIIKEETKSEIKNKNMIHIFRKIAELSGFEIVGRITMKEKKTGRVFR